LALALVLWPWFLPQLPSCGAFILCCWIEAIFCSLICSYIAVCHFLDHVTWCYQTKETSEDEEIGIEVATDSLQNNTEEEVFSANHEAEELHQMKWNDWCE